MSTAAKPRVSPGVPAGGEFTAYAHQDPNIRLAGFKAAEDTFSFRPRLHRPLVRYRFPGAAGAKAFPVHSCMSERLQASRTAGMPDGARLAAPRCAWGFWLSCMNACPQEY